MTIIGDDMIDDDADINRRRVMILNTLREKEQKKINFEEADRILASEPEAKHRRLRSYAKINLDDVKVYSDLLRQEFPELIYFFANYKVGVVSMAKFPDDVPIVFFPSLYNGVMASLDHEKERQGALFNRRYIYCRWPWPHERATNDPEHLIGGRYEPSDVFRLALQYRDEGRWFSFRYRCRGYVDPRQEYLRFGRTVLELGKLPLDQYPEISILTGQPSEFFAVYDFDDPETTAFAKRAHALWRRIATKDMAVYDPISRLIVDVPNWNGRSVGSIGRCALAGALETPARYAAYASWPSDRRNEGPALMVGPKPKKVRAKKG